MEEEAKNDLPLYSLIFHSYNLCLPVLVYADWLLIRWSRVRISADPPALAGKRGALAQLVEQRTLKSLRDKFGSV